MALKKVKLQPKEKFFALIGECVSRWAHVDRYLFEFCSYALKADKNMTAVVFYRSPSIGEHLGLATSLMRLALQEDAFRKRWTALSRDIGNLLPFRNEIAHNPVQSVSNYKLQISETRDKFVLAFSNHYWELTTEPNKLLKSGKKKPQRIRQVDLVEHHTQLRKIEADASSLLRDLGVQL